MNLQANEGSKEQLRRDRTDKAAQWMKGNGKIN
jgi:hypothetical protein